MTLTIFGAPRTKKTHQRIARRRDGRPFILPAKTSSAWADSAVLQLRAAYRRLRVLKVDRTPGREAVTVDYSCGEPVNTPVNVRALFYRDALRGDAVGFYQALADALEAAGVVENDRLCVSWDGSRLLKDAKNPRVEVTLEPAT